MNRTVWPLPLAVLCLLLPCACMDDDYEYSSDCYISTVTLGNVKRLINTVATSGNDTSYYISYSGSYFPMTVNQLNNTIYNKDSLVYNSDVSSVLAEIVSSGTVIYKVAGADDDSWNSYSTTDSIDFSSPLTLRVYAPDNSAYRDYTLWVNIHQQNGEEFTWNTTTESVPWSATESLKAIVWGDNVWVFSEENGSVRLFTSDVNDGATWTEQTLSGCDAEVSTVTVFGDSLYMSGTDGSLIGSADGLEWTTIAADHEVHLVAAEESKMFAISGGALFSSSDGVTWTEDELDDETSYLPVQDFSSATYTQENGIRRTLFVGNRSLTDYPSDEGAMVWSHSRTIYQDTAGWVFFNASPDNSYPCPRLNSLNILPYDDVVVAFGLSSLDGTTHESFDSLYVSVDNGITWATDDAYTLPSDLTGQDVVMSATVDSDYFIWIITSAQVWRGRLNELGFDE